MKRAFTLIELLVVIAITAILMTIILVPIIQSFNLTRSAQAFADAQDKARRLTEKIAREINNAASVRDNSGIGGQLSVVVPARPGSGSSVPGYDTTHGPFIRVTVNNVKLDIVAPFEGDPTNTRAGAFVNPQTGMADPTLQRPKGQISLPLAPGMTIVRYFIALRNPLRIQQPSGLLAGYIEPYSGLLQTQSGDRDNLFVLYRAEIQPYIWNGTKFVVNKAFFFDQDRDNDPNTFGPLLDDPTFFDPAVANPAYSIPDPTGSPDPTKAQMVQNWLSKSVIQTEVSRFDMIQPQYDLHTRLVTFDGDAPRLQPLVQFKPTRIASEPATGQAAVRLGEETDNSSQLAPDVFRSKYGGWSNLMARVYKEGYSLGNPYQVGLKLPTPGPGDPQGFSIYMYLPGSGYDDSQVGRIPGVGVELFDADTYLKGLRSGIRANFSRGILAANSRSGWLTNVGYRTSVLPFVPDMNRGRIIASFGIDEVGSVGAAPSFTPVPLPDPVYNPNNLPGNVTWPDSSDVLSPINDPNLAGNFYDAAFSSINKKFNKVWNDHPELHPDNVHRFIDLRVTQNSDGSTSPLSPDPATGFSSARIVTGSEQVFGPDQMVGPNYGRRIRYTRTTREPGPNQYRINYVDQPEPNYALIGYPNPPVAYDPTNFVSAVIQARYRAGYIQFNSDPNVPLPGDDPSTTFNEAQILVYYRFQFTHPKDVVAVDYDSRQLMSVLLTIKNYPQASLPNPQSVTLKSTAEVRNFLR